MTTTKNIIAQLTFALQILLLFALLFESYLDLPKLLQPLGRMHPLVLHLPIGMLLLLALFPLLKKEVSQTGYLTIQSFSIHVIAFFSVVAAIMGLFLSQEAGYESELVEQHKWTGALFSFLTYGLLLWHNRFAARQTTFNVLTVSSAVLLMVTGHLGGSITHGEDFVLAPIKPKEKIVITDETPVFQAAIQPTLEAKCYACHKPTKSKGELIMTSVDALLKGGEHGPIWIAGNADSSQMIQRANLPLEDELHMPPKGKPQLTSTEIELLYQWVQNGADLELTIGEVKSNDTLYTFVERVLEERNVGALADEKEYDFDFADEATIASLNTPFCSVAPLAYGEPALRADIFVRATYQPASLEALSAIKEQLVALNLTNLPIKDEDLSFIAQFSRLEKLTLNNTDITGATLKELKECQNLKQLAISGTQVTPAALETLKDFPALEQVYAWNTSISKAEADGLVEDVNWTIETGFVPDEDEKLKLSVPVLKNKTTLLEEGEQVVLQTKFPGAIIRYTTDNTEPDSLNSPIYESPIPVNGLTTIKAKTFHESWLGSDEVAFTFFPKGLQPDTAILITPPNDKYKGNGAMGLIDKEKGEPTNFSNKAWLGYQDNYLKALIDFGEEPPVVNEVVGSFAQNLGPEIFPPTKVTVWGGNSVNNMVRLSTKSPEIPKDYTANRLVGVVLPLSATQYRYYRIEIEPIQQIPRWHQLYRKGRKGWVFVDEIFFY